MQSTDTFARLYILVGIPGCGKSTWADLYLSPSNIAYVGSDAIRAELSHIHDQTRNNEVFDIFHADIARQLAHGNSVVADSTALDAFARERLYTIAETHNAAVHIIFFKNVYQGIARNARRTRKVPFEAMERMLDKYERTLDNLSEEIIKHDIIHSCTEISKFG